MTFRLLKSIAKKLSRRELNKRLLAFICDLPPGSRILNIGSGGDIMGVIRNAPHYPTLIVTSSDIDPLRSPDIVDDITSSSFEENSFDAIVCAEVLEHVTEPNRAIFHLDRILIDGGSVFLSTPFLFPTHDAPCDHYRFTEFGLKYLLRGWEIKSFHCKTDWVETFLLLMWRQMWLDSRAAKWSVLMLTILLSPVLIAVLVTDRTARRTKSDKAFTSGFIVLVDKHK